MAQKCILGYRGRSFDGVHQRKGQKQHSLNPISHSDKNEHIYIKYHEKSKKTNLFYETKQYNITQHTNWIRK